MSDQTRWDIVYAAWFALSLVGLGVGCVVWKVAAGMFQRKD